MPKTRAQRRIDNNGATARRVITVIGGSVSGGGVLTHVHDIYTTPSEVNDLITTKLTSLGLETAGTWEINGSVGYIDLVHASGDSTLQIINSDATSKANLQVEGDLTVLGSIYNTGPITGQEWAWATDDNMYISANYAAGPSTVQILNDSATYDASLFVEDAIDTGGDITAGGDFIGQTLSYPDTALYIEANNVAASTVYVRNTDATAKASLNVEDSISAGGNVTATGNLAGVNGTLSGTLGVTGVTTLSDDLNVDSGVLFVDASANMVGINDATPSYGLDVNGTFRTTGAATLQSTLAVTGVTTLANDLNVDSGVLFVDVSTNKVGINDATPSYDLDVNGTLRATGVTTLDNNATVGGTLGVTGNVTASANLTVGVDLTVTDDATFNDTVTVVGDMTLPYWELDATTGTLQTTGDYAFLEPSATADYEGIRLMPSSGSVEAAYVSASQFAAETMVFEQVAVNTGDLIIAKSGGKLRAAATFLFKRSLVDDAGNQIVDSSGNAIVLHDSEVSTTIQLEHPPVGEISLLTPGDQIIIAGRPALAMWSYGTGTPLPPTRFYPAAVVSPATSDMPVKLRCVVVSVSSSDVNEYVVRVVGGQNLAYESLTFSAGSAVASYGTSGDAYLTLQTRNKRAFMDIGTLPGTGWENDLTPFIRLGHIGGLVNVADPSDVGLVGGDIDNGVDAYFKIAQSGIVLSNGDHVIRDSDGINRVSLNTNGLEMRIDSVQISTVGKSQIEAESGRQSAITFVDDIDDPDEIYSALSAYRVGGFENAIALRSFVNSEFLDTTVRIGVADDEAAIAGINIVATPSRGTGVVSIATPGTSGSAFLVNSPVALFYASKFILPNLPTSAAGLQVGAVWNDGGTLRVVT